ncbi:uncharacterized protein LOC128894835 [Hylaeus anthracinus]|uniref:uncharacterized protein LOC128894835 n=1 Tax=Hylaeus anthracinus TaxID=313031 RepID=UPI0023B972E8|nr:uncharacterized protein LOC128894835 [Hylaeus anthracinus]
MMKFALAVLAVLAVSSPLNAYTVPRTGNGALADELQDFVDLLPLDQIDATLHKYLENDPELKEVLTYLHSSELLSLVADIEALPDVVSLFNYMQSAGVDEYYLVNKANAFLGLPALQPSATLMNLKSGGVRGLIDEIHALIPEDKLWALYRQKMANAPVFAQYMAVLRSPAAQRIVDGVTSDPNFPGFLAHALKYGVDVNHAVDFIQQFFGVTVHLPMKFALVVLAVLAVSSPLEAYKFPRAGSGALADELQDFVDAIPLDEMLGIFFQYLSEDTEFQTFVTYMRSKEFTTLIKHIEDMPEVIDLLNYVQKAGLDIYLMVNRGNDFLGLPRLQVPNVAVNFKITGGIRGLLDDIEAIYPKQKVHELFEYKLAHSKVFAGFYARLSAPSMQNVANGILADPNWNGFFDKISKAGVNVEDAKEFIEKFFHVKINH